MRTLLVCAATLLFVPPASAAERASVRSYGTHFPFTEDPLSNGGKWSNGASDGMDWYNVITKNGVAYGAVSKGAYTDPTAVLRGLWGKNQAVRATRWTATTTDPPPKADNSPSGPTHADTPSRSASAAAFSGGSNEPGLRT
jgi:hypothetical protein